MEILLIILLLVLIVLYLKERGKNKQIEKEFHYINTRLTDITHQEETNYILIPSDSRIVKETAQNINGLLEKFYHKQIESNQNQKIILQLFTNISHDLRTPITVLKGYIEMLYLQSQKEELSPSMKMTVEKMQSNSEELVRSINNIFNMAKIQSGDLVLNIQNVNLTQLCHEIILEFYDLLEKEHFDVVVNIREKPVYADADAEAVQRIIKNLIDNAIKYGGGGKFLGISLYRKNSHIYIAVEDHGMGIPEKDRKHIFTRAYTSDRKKGNGLGLAISQELAKSMGGTIFADSTPYQKTVFTLVL